MKLREVAHDSKGKLILTFEDDNVQIEVCLTIGEAERVVDVVSAEIQDLLRARRANIGVGL